jgi:hypothetical protein
MLARKLLVGCLALVLLTRTVHCLYLDVALCAAAATAHSHTPPLSDPTDSDPNESGCLCKGALFGTPCLIAALPLQGKLLLPAPIKCSAGVVAVGPQSAPALRGSLSPPPVSGRMLRALIASWQI